MAFETGFDYKELTKFQKKMTEQAEEFPNAANRFLKNEGQTLKRRMVKKANSSLKKQPTGNYMAGFARGKRVYEWNDAKFNLRVYNSSPHAHLIEYGHKACNHDGSPTGNYVPGKHIIENAAIEFEQEFSRHLEDKLASQILKELAK